MKRSPLAGHQQPGTSCLTLSRGLDGVDGRRHTHLGGALELTCVRPACGRVDQQPRPPAKSPAELRAEHTRALPHAHSSHAGCGKLRAGTNSPRLQSHRRAAGVMQGCTLCRTGVDHSVVAKTPVRAAPAVGWSGDTAGLPLPRVRQASESRYRRRGGGQWSRPYGHPLWCPATIPSRVSPLARPPPMPTSGTSPRPLLLLADDGCPSPPTRTERATGGEN